MSKDEKRFTLALSQKVSFGESASILVDNLTGVNYLYFSSGYGGGMTPLLNRDGSVIVSPVPYQNNFDNNIH